MWNFFYLRLRLQQKNRWFLITFTCKMQQLTTALSTVCRKYYSTWNVCRNVTFFLWNAVRWYNLIIMCLICLKYSIINQIIITFIMIITIKWFVTKNISTYFLWEPFDYSKSLRLNLNFISGFLLFFINILKPLT